LRISVVLNGASIVQPRNKLVKRALYSVSRLEGENTERERRDRKGFRARRRGRRAVEITGRRITGTVRAASNVVDETVSTRCAETAEREAN